MLRQPLKRRIRLALGGETFFFLKKKDNRGTSSRRKVIGGTKGSFYNNKRTKLGIIYFFKIFLKI